MHRVYLAALGPWGRADAIALATLVLGLIAFGLAWWTLHRGNLNSSVASMIPLNAEIRQMQDELVSVFPSEEVLEELNEAQLSELENTFRSKLERLLNVLEISAAIDVERTLSGVSRKLMSGYLERTLSSLMSDDYTSSKISGLLQDAETYIYIRKFLRSRPDVSDAFPSNWYAIPKRSWFEHVATIFKQ
jgi:hypothetical protein